jgi:transposase
MGTGKSSFCEWRRMQALHLSKQGWTQWDIAAALDVTQGAVSQWLAAVRRGGPDALRAQPRPGRPARLTLQQKRLIPDFLGHGAEAYGFRGEVWTCPRIAKVLRQEYGVSYSRSQVSRLMKEVQWTPQIPMTRALQRDEQVIEHWRVEVWPQIQQHAQKEHQTVVFVDESGFYLLPSVVKTYGPRGLTPILKEWQTRDHLSVMGAVTPQGKVYSLVHQESLTGLHTVAFLMHLLRVAGQRLLVIWDGSPIHRCTEVKQFLAEGAARWIHIEPLPPYAPDLNPVEWMWTHLKDVEMRNLVCLDLEQLHMEFHLALGRTRQRPHLVTSFFAGAQLTL